MTPQKLVLHNFLSYQESACLDFDQFHLAVLSGQNGVGKSSILEAITWVIWGKTRAASDDDLVYQGQTNAWVEFIFSHQGEKYRLVRRRNLKRKKGESTLEFQIETKQPSFENESWQSIAEATYKATQAKIIDILKIPYEIFINSSYLRQGHADEFTTKTPAERKEVLADVLGLNFYQRISEAAREKAKFHLQNIKLMDFQINDLQASTGELETIKQAFLKKTAELKILKNQQNKLKDEIKNLNQQKTSYEVLQEKLTTLRGRFREIQEEIILLQEEKKNLLAETEKSGEKLLKKSVIYQGFQNLQKFEKLLEKENLKFQAYAKWQERLKVLEHIEEETLKNVRRITKISTCPMCLRPMRENEARSISQHLKDEFQKKYLPELKKIRLRLTGLNYQSQNHQKIREKLKGLQTFREEKQALDLAINSKNNSQKTLAKINHQIQELLKVSKKIKIQGEKLNKDLAPRQNITVFLQEKIHQEEIINNQIFELQNILGQLEKELEQIKKQKETIANKEKERAQTEKDYQIYEELTLVFSKKGLQAMLMENSLIIIEEEANHLLKKITGGRMSLKILTQKEKKSAPEEDLIETLDIQIADELGRRPYEMFSGGEAFRINFAIRVALSKLLASRAGTRLQFLAIDEGFGTLDSAGRDDIVSAINAISQDFEKIIVITHLEEFKDLFPTLIQVTKDETGSHLEMISP